MHLYANVCELLGLHRMALRSYERKIFHDSRYPSRREFQNRRWEWIECYEHEENRGIQLLQRYRSLEEERDSVIGTTANMEGDWQEGKPPIYESTPDQHNQQLEEILKQYRSHRNKLEKLEAEKPLGSPIIRRWELLRRSKNRQGLTMAWVRDSQACARRGGCCGRNCGCCEKPQREFLMPTGDSRGKKLSGIYGHCTSECPCCVRSPGFYKPNAAKHAPSNSGNEHKVALTPRW